MQPKNDPRLALPQPDKASAAHSLQVERHLQNTIAANGGSISFAEFMHECLYAPGLGYYAAGSAKFGAEGDFVTAPEISPLFGRVLAKQMAGVLAQTGGDILELGAGSGALAISVLTKLAELDALPERYRILEVSADLTRRQAARIATELPEHADRVDWITEIPADFTGVVIGNEVADALPVERFLIKDDAPWQARVIHDGDDFAWRFERAPAFLTAAVGEAESATGRRLKNGYQSEVSPALEQWMRQISSCVTRGLVMLIDYGMSRREYYAPDRESGWLRCYFRHRGHRDPLIFPGIQDITCWVDFSLLASAATRENMGVAGYVTQSDLLLHGGLAEECANFTDLPMTQQVTLSGQLKQLTLPDEMGESFKCIALTRGNFEPPAVFVEQDRAHVL